MGIPTTGTALAEVPANKQVRWRIADAEYKPHGAYGPEITTTLDITTPEYAGVSALYSLKIQRPRLDKVERLRKEGLDDEAIAQVLKKQGFTFNKIDELDTETVARGGNLYKVLVANCGGNRAKAEKVLSACDGFEELARALVGGAFVGTTKLSDKGYVRLDGNEDIFPDVGGPEAAEELDNAEWEEIPDYGEPPPVEY